MKKVLLPFALALCVSALWGVDFGAYGYMDKGERTVDGIVYTILANNDGAELQFRSVVDPSPERLKALAELDATLRSWKSFDIAALRAVNEGDRLILTLVPRKVQYGGMDITAALPGGLVIYFAASPEYDFRVKSGDYILRVRGFLSGESDLMDTVLSAVKDPVTYLAQRDPQYAIRRITEISLLVTKLQATTDGTFGEHKQALDELQKATEDLQKNLDEQASAVADLQKMLSDQEKAFQDSDSKAAARTAIIENSLMATMNKGFFGGPKPLNAAAMAKLIELKTADPTLNRKTAEAALKAAGITPNSKEIDIIFTVKFGENP